MKRQHPAPFSTNVAPWISVPAGLSTLDAVYRAINAIEGVSPANFCREALDYMNAPLVVDAEPSERIPASGPVIVVANHPFGAIEGLAILDLVQRARPDAKVMANYLLTRIPEMAANMIAVDPFGGRTAASRNLGPLKAARRWLNEGKALAIFPAGMVAHWRPEQRRVAEPDWAPSIARLIRRSRATVIPVFFDGQNRWRFHLAGMIHPRLRTALLPRELLHRMGDPIHARIGHAISWQSLEHLDDDQRLIEYLRLRTLLLGKASGTGAATEAETNRRKPLVSVSRRRMEAERLQQNLAALPDDAMLVQQKQYSVWFAEAAELPEIMPEIGRLREETFRHVGEGTGKAIDIMNYDDYYRHLFLWDESKRRIAGAYRIGQTDRIIEERGVPGLFVNRLFKIRKDLWPRIHPALELGRSWVHPDYQRDYLSLHMLWQGIGNVLIRQPRYRYLLGPASMSARYQTTSMRLMLAFLRANHLDTELSREVHPRFLPARLDQPDTELERIVELAGSEARLSRLIAELEPDAKGIPVLLRQYLKLGARVLAFNVDRQFSGVLDSLLLVDVTLTERRILDRYMGREGTARYLDHHMRTVATTAA